MSKKFWIALQGIVFLIGGSSLGASLPQDHFMGRGVERAPADYLKRFTGDFECALFSVTVTFDGEHLKAIVPGQVSCALTPEGERCFSVEELPGCSLEFVDGTEGRVSELYVQHGEHVFVLKAVS